MSKKPRAHPALLERPKRRPGQKVKHVIQDEFRNCETPGCPNVVSVQDRPPGPVHCVLHRNAK